jgi:Card1-like, endonuclease domain
VEHDHPPILVCLISRQTMQNLLPILQAQPQRVVFIATKEEDESRLQLEAVLRGHQITAEAPLYVDAYAPDSTLEACRQIIARHGANQLTANITGGTKVMSIAAFRAFSAADVPCTYTPNRRLLYLYPDGHDAEPLQMKVEVLTYLHAHGQLASLRARDARLSLPDLAAFIGQHIARLDPFLGRLRYEMRNAAGRSSIRFPVEGRQRQAIAGELVLRAMRAGVLQATKAGTRELEIVFDDERARRYLDGEWLEDLVFEAVKHGGFDSCASNIALAWKDAPHREMNEIDIAVVHNLRFFYLSCKTGSDANQMKQHLYELETLSDLAGGLFNHPILVGSSAKAVPAYLRRRMEALGIMYVGPQDLPHLSSRLQALIR